MLYLQSPFNKNFFANPEKWLGDLNLAAWALPLDFLHKSLPCVPTPLHHYLPVSLFFTQYILFSFSDRSS